MIRKFLALLIIFPLLPVDFVHGQGNDISAGQHEASVILVSSDQNGAILEMTAPVYHSQILQQDGREYQAIDVPGAELASEPGEPALPVLSAMLGIPPGARLELVVLSDEAFGVDGRFSLLPSSAGNPPDDIIPPDGRLPQVSSFDEQASAQYPISPVRVDEAWLREQHIARLVFYPLQYQPAQGSLIWHKSLRVQVRFVNDSSGSTSYRSIDPDRSSPFESIYQASLLNYDQARAWRAIALPEQADSGVSLTTYEASGPRYKITVDQDGLYRLTYADLQAAGMQVDLIDPTTFHMSSQGNDIAIYVSGEADHDFNPTDSITFYGEKFRGDLLAQRYASEGSNYRSFARQLPDGSYTIWSPQFNASMLEKYTNDNVYWLQVGGAGGPRMTARNGTPGSSSPPVPAGYSATVHAEENNYWYTYNFSSEDTWYWERIQDQNQHLYPINLSARAAGSFQATVRGEIVAASSNTSFNPDHHTQVWLNYTNNLVDDAQWDGISRYYFEAQVPESYLVEAQNQLILKVNFDAYPNQPTDHIYFDWYEIQYPRRFQVANDQISFTRDEAGQAWRYPIGGFSPGNLSAEVYDITNPFNPIRVTGASFGSGTLTFDSNQSGNVNYFAAGSLAVKNPKSLSYYNPPDLKNASNSADYLIITHHDFLTAAQTLANMRAAQGLETMLVDVADLYNEFNDGIYHSIAIKNFLSYTYQTWTKAPTYVVLIGDGHWNLLSSTVNYLAPPIYMPPHLAWVDPWQGEVDSANLLAAVAGTDILPDMHIARMPVNSTAELNAIINKIQTYESGPLQDWQRRVMFVVDDPDEAGNFSAFTDAIVADYLRPGFLEDRVTNKVDCGATGLPACRDVIDNQLSTTGALIANYTGHAAINYWAESMFSSADVSSLSNGSRLPVVLSLDCLDGYWIYPGLKSGSQAIPSLIETMLRASNQGAVGAFSPTGLGVATGHDALQRGFYDALFNNGLWELGNASLSAKLRLYGTGSNFDLIHTFTVFGDPAMALQEPFQEPLIDPAADENTGKRGNVVKYTINVDNLSLVPDSYDISVFGNDWTTGAPVSIGPIPAGDDRFFEVSVSIPPNAGLSDTDTATITIASRGDRKEVVATTLTTHIDQQTGVLPIQATLVKVGMRGQQAAFQIQFMNTGATTDTFDIAVSGWDWTTDIFPDFITIAPGQRGLVSVIVTIPPTAAVGSQDTVRLRAISRDNPNTWADALLTTIAYGIFLPEIQQ